MVFQVTQESILVMEDQVILEKWDYRDTLEWKEHKVHLDQDILVILVVMASQDTQV